MSHTSVAEANPGKPRRKRVLSFDEEGYPILVVGICGGTGSGKTTMARAIIERFGADRVTHITHDLYYRDLSHLPKEERALQNFDHPDILETELMVQHVDQLRRGQTVEIPQYDFSNHLRMKETLTTQPNRVILIEGILIFADPQLVELMDIKVFVETPDDIRFIRRLRRDMQERGRSADSVMGQYLETVRPMHMTFVEPSKRVADILVPQGVNAVALDMITSRLEKFMADPSNL